ncbi:MAG TPA: AmmeMemoRadiSam system protein B [Bryobacteraceae bacterium]|nr:AmmeMemoRadiSam system protein B [Bryobacteraceae bacterium]
MIFRCAGLVLLFLLCSTGHCKTRESEAVRPPAVAGSFYPADPGELARMIDGFLSKADGVPIPGLVAVVSPHAGYIYSGQVAAYTYAQLKGRRIERVVLIAPSHYDAFPFSAVYDGAAYLTPLGRVPVDRAFAAQLAKSSRLIQLSSRGHVNSGERGEHSVEVQLPFLQRVLGPFQLVPVVMGDQSYQVCRALGLALAKMIRGPETLILASSDLSHYHTYDEAARMDHKTLQAITEWDYLSMSRNFDLRTWEACGGGPIIAAMIAAERLGANQARVLQYANTGDVTGDKSRVVGYGSVVMSRDSGQPGAAAPAFSLTRDEREWLLQIARKSVEAVVRDGKLYECSPGTFQALARERGAFVTLKEHGMLRGCIGYTSPVKPLCEAVRDVAAMAAVRDRRFPPVTLKELGSLEYEISVLSPLRRVLDVKQIRLGRDGLVLKRGESEGLFLPQVPVEQGWDRPTYLEQLCHKAGLPPGTWKDDEADLFSFTALVFGEHPTRTTTWAPGLPPPATGPYSEIQIAGSARH